MLKTLVSEIRRRNVLPTILPYLGLVWLLLQVVSVLQPMFNLHPLVSATTAILLFAAFPSVLYLSWYFNITLDGLQAIPNVNSDEPVLFGKAKWLILVLITIGSGALGFFYFEQLKHDFSKLDEGTSQVAELTSIAVIPFRDQSSDQDQSFITEGLTEELTALLGKSSNLKVAAASSTFALADKKLTPVDIGKRLGVESIVTGSLRVTGNRLKIRTELVDTATNMTLWSETFSREFKDIFAIEEEISRSIVNLLEDRYLEKGQVSSAAKTANTDAYVMYLKGREQYRIQTTESMTQARKFFEQAIAFDPEYALAYVGLADALAMLSKQTSGFGHDAFFGVLDKDIAKALSQSNIEKALLRDTDMAEAYALRGLILAMIDSNFDDALSALNKAIKINPSFAKAYMWKFLVLHKQGKMTDAWETLQRAYELDPVSIATQHNRGFYLMQMGELEQAKQQYLQLTNDFGNSPFGYAGLATISYTIGDLSSSLEYWNEAVKLSPDNENFLISLIDTMTSLGLVEQARQVSEQEYLLAEYLLVENRHQALFVLLEQQMAAYPDDPWLLFEYAWYQALVGEQQQAIDYFMRSYSLFSATDLYHLPLCSPAIEIAWALQQTAKTDQANGIIEECQRLQLESDNFGVNVPFKKYTQARSLVLQGSFSDAASMLSLAIDNGLRQWWVLEDPLLEPLYQTPQGARLKQRLAKLIDQERAEAQQLIKHVDLYQKSLLQ